MKKLKCLIFVEVDVVVRHFIHNQSFKNIVLNHEVKFVFPNDTQRFHNIDPEKLKLSAPYVRINHNEKRHVLWKKMLHINQLQFKFGKQEKALRKLRRKTLKWKAFLLYTFLGLPMIWHIYKFVKFRHLFRSTNLKMLEVFEDFKPDLAIHPCVLEGVFINDLIQITKEKKIPSIVIMNSWDNPSTKNAMVGNPDWLLVWGKQTQTHAIKYCKMKEKNVIQFGAAQFDLYRKPSKIIKKNFHKNYKFEVKDVIILFAGSSVGTDEIKQLTLLDNAINQGLFKDVKIIYRPHPWGGGGKNGSKIFDQKWNNIKFDRSMINYLNNLKIGVKDKYLSDYSETHDILSNIDAVISPLSTILIEAAIHGKPSLCFLPDEDRSTHFEINVGLDHFKDIFESKLFLKANGYKDLIPKTLDLIELLKSDGLSIKLKEGSEYYVKNFNKPFANRLNEFIEKI